MIVFVGRSQWDAVKSFVDNTLEDYGVALVSGGFEGPQSNLLQLADALGSSWSASPKLTRARHEVSGVIHRQVDSAPGVGP